jgi:hypothetical protein
MIFWTDFLIKVEVCPFFVVPIFNAVIIFPREKRTAELLAEVIHELMVDRLVFHHDVKV